MVVVTRTLLYKKINILVMEHVIKTFVLSI